MPIQSALVSFFSTYPTRIYKKGETLIEAGDMPSAYYLLGGLVTQYDIAKNGAKLTLNTYKPGVLLPLSSILNDIPARFFFDDAEPTTVHVAPPADARKFLKDNPDVTYDALARMARGGEGLMLRLARAMEGAAEERIIQELLIVRDRFFKDSGVIAITETDLAAKTGLARETVSRTLKKLDTQGIIRSRRGTITFSDEYHI